MPFRSWLPRSDATWRVLTLAAALVVPAARTGHAQPTEPSHPFDDAAERLRALAPHVETACGAKFEAPPAVEVLSLDAAIPIFAADMRYEIALKYPAVPESARERLLAGRARSAVLSCVARYSVSRKRILLVREGFDRQADALDLPAGERRGFLDAVLVHEAVHALDDARFDLGALFAGATDLEALHARAMVVEGRAVVFGRRAGHAAGLPAAHVDGLPGGAEPKTIGAFRARFTYAAGAAYVAARIERGGTREADAALARPPASTHAVFHPQARDPGAGVGTARTALEDGGLQSPAELSELALRSRYASRLGEARCTSLFARFRGGAQVLIDGVNVAALVFADETAARAFEVESAKETATGRRGAVVLRAAGTGAADRLARILASFDRAARER